MRFSLAIARPRRAPALTRSCRACRRWGGNQRDLVAHCRRHGRCTALAEKEHASWGFDDPFKEILGYDVRRAASASGAELRGRRTRIVDKLF